MFIFNCKKRSLKHMQYVVITSVLLNLGTVYAQQEEMAQGPIFAGSVETPNVMFTLDDSGSMFWEFMPDDLYSGITTGWNSASVFSLGDYYAHMGDPNASWGTTKAVTDNRRLILKSRFNTIYYNPDTTYTPWAKPDGTTMPNSSPTCALHFPDLSQSGIPGLTF